MKSQLEMESRHNSMLTASPRKDITGEKYGKLLVVGNPKSYTDMSRRRILWECICECGKKSYADSSALKKGTIKSCGCSHFNQGGLAKSEKPLYDIWRLMHRRCYQEKNNSFKDYGAKGIKVCKRWHDFSNFVADMSPRPEGMTLDRYKPGWSKEDKPLEYSPENCRWATRLEQQNNTTTNLFIEYDGKRLTTAQWARETGISSGTIRHRIHAGWGIEKALTLKAVVGRNGSS